MGAPSTVPPLVEPTSRRPDPHRPDPSDPNIRKVVVKVFVQVPCLNEEQTLPAVLAASPSRSPVSTSSQILIIDDGSTDRTLEVARELGVTHFVHHVRNMGLARSFRDGVTTR
jgi:cellulose synthase/poly-beta-1,6-N-acetylglucosamine synthase-like glycosyltransferase